MALIVQDETGEVQDANGYISTEELDDYLTLRGRSFPTTTKYTTGTFVEKKGFAIIEATDYLDLRFRYIGRTVIDLQTTEWPRRYLRPTSGRYFIEIPQAIKDACAELAVRAAVADLLKDPARDAGGRRLERDEYELEGKIRRNREFVANSDLELPEYRMADLTLRRARLIRVGGDVIRA